LYWSFGYANLISSILNDSFYDSYGDMVFFTDYFEKDKIQTLIQDPSIERVVLDREIQGILENPEKSDLVILSELTPDNQNRLKRYIRPVVGTLPKNTEDIVVSEFLKEGQYQLGETVTMQISTPDKVINAKKFKVCGITKSSGWKGLGSAFLITEESMTELLASNRHANVISVFLKNKNETREAKKEIYQGIKKTLEENKLEIKDSWMTYEQMDKLASFSGLFASVKSLVMILFFPLIGAVSAAIVWMYAFRRRKELWTYSALGMTHGSITVLMAFEYWILTLTGIITGLGIGSFTSYLAEKANIWFRFSYTFVSPLLTEIHTGDIVLIVMFLLLCVTFWIIPPLKRIVKAPPFSY